LVFEVAKLKEWRCIELGHHDTVAQTIEKWEKAGWRLHTYSTAGMGEGFAMKVNHYLLFVRGE
jgi:hypothetical protein